MRDLIEFCRDRGTAGIVADGEPHGHRVHRSGQIRALSLRLELEAASAQRPDFRLQGDTATPSNVNSPSSSCTKEPAGIVVENVPT